LVSIRRACEVLKTSRSMYSYKSLRSDQAFLRKRIRDIAETRVRYGYKRIHTLLKREGWAVNHKRVYRIYCEENLQMRNKTPKRRVKAKLREDRQVATEKNECWSMDFMHDQLFDGTKIRCLTVIDKFSRLCPAIGVRKNYKAHDVVETLEGAVKTYGCPRRIRVDNGPEFISTDLDLWAYARGVVLDFSRPGKPTDNAYIESFNSRFRQECLNQHWFMDMEDARCKIEAWRLDYNERRPHSSIGNLTPVEFVKSSAQSCLSTLKKAGFSHSSWP
jgi:putative transposase